MWRMPYLGRRNAHFFIQFICTSVDCYFLDVVIHTQVSADSTDYICSVMYNLYNGLQRALNMINWNGVVSTMSDVLHPNSVSPWAVSQCHPTTSWDEFGPEL